MAVSNIVSDGNKILKNFISYDYETITASGILRFCEITSLNEISLPNDSVIPEEYL